MQLILKTSLSLQSEPKVVYFGPPATFTHLAALKSFGKGAELIPAKSVREIFSIVEKRQVEFGVVPVENSTEGVVTHTLDMFLDSDLRICAEIILEISHHLLGRGTLEKVEKIYSHPQAFAQCRKWLQQYLPNAVLTECSSTADAARKAQVLEVAKAQQNAVIGRFNERICQVLAVATGQHFPANPDIWWQWWNDKNEVYYEGAKPVKVAYRREEVSFDDPYPDGPGQTMLTPRPPPSMYECLVAGTPVWTTATPSETDSGPSGRPGTGARAPKNPPPAPSP